MNSYLTMADLRNRGWNERLVKSFLGSPDETSSMPNQKAGRPHRLYLLHRVLDIENTSPEFAMEKKRIASFSQRAKKSIDVKRQQLKEIVDSFELPVFVHPYSLLFERARMSPAATDTPGSIERVALKDLLATMKSMEEQLALYQWHSGVCEARIILKKKILEHIVKSYPALEQAAASELASDDGGGK